MEEQKLKSKRSQKYNSNHQLSSSVSEDIVGLLYIFWHSTLQTFKGTRAVSEPFVKCFEGISSDIMAFLGPSEFKALSIHPIANPVLQVIAYRRVLVQPSNNQ